MLKKIKVQIEGIHCKSCKILIETEVDILEGVNRVDVNHQTGACEIEFDDEKISQKRMFESIEKLGYKVDVKKTINSENLSANRQGKKINRRFSRNFIIAGVLLVLFVVVYYLIKQFGLLELMGRLNEQNLSYWLIFLVGVLASFHCVGMCGGLVITYTARHHARNEASGKEEKATKAHLQYNLGRIISYTIIGGILGGAGSFFGINPTFTGVIILVAGGFMVLMGLSLMTNFSWLEKIKLRTPSFIARFLYNQKYTKKPKGPFIIGLLNGLMPCGPLQAMQFYALASGSITRGALSMGIYALGTAPLMFGFGSFISLISKEKIKQVMKFSGAVVIILGIVMLNRGLINFGYGFRSFIPKEASSQTEYIVDGNISEYQVVNMDLTYRGYSPNVLFIKKDVPARWIINVKQMSGCTDEIIMPDYNIKKQLEYGENIIEFVPDKLGEIKFSCWMQMVWGKFVVSENELSAAQKKLDLEKVDLPQGACSSGGSCGGTCAAAQTGGCGCSRIKSR